MRSCFGCTAFPLAVLSVLAGCAPQGARLIEAPLIESYGWQTPGRGIELEASAMLRGRDDSGVCRTANKCSLRGSPFPPRGVYVRSGGIRTRHR